MKVSVVIPCYNVESYIEECIESVLKQDYQDLEIICVDNKSTDKTWAVLKKVSEKNPIIRLAKESKQGAPATRNLGIKLSNGEYIQFLDADDLLKPQKISKQIQHIQSLVKKPDVLLEGFVQYDETSGKTHHEYVAHINVWVALAQSRVGITSSNLYKRVPLVKAGCWDEDILSSQDTWLLFKLLKHGAEISHTRNLNTIRRYRLGSISKTNKMENWKRYLDLRLALIDFLKKHDHDLFIAYEEEFSQSLFYPIRSIYKYNPEISIELYNKYLKGILLKKKGSVSKSYIFIHNLFGYKFAQKIKSII